jgi:tetratricopeptide (TPR) repeat protein
VKEDHVLFLRQHSLMPLHELFVITHSSPEYNEGDRRGVFYAESWALMHYLLWDKPERRPQFEKFLAGLTQGEDPDTAFAAAFEAPYQALENELRSFVSGGRFLFTRLDVKDLGVDDTVAVAPMKRAETLSRLGDLLVHIGDDRAAEAAEYFAEAHRLDPEYAPALAGQGYAACLAGRRDEGIASFDKAIALDPDDAMMRFHLGECILESDAEGAVKRAADMFLKVIALRQGFAEAYVEVAHALMLQGGEPGPAIHLLEAARPVLPSRADVVVNLAWLYASKGDTAKANDLVENVLARMNDREALEQGRRFVRKEEERVAAGRAAASPPDKADEQADDSPPPVDPYSRHVLAYNQAVALANKKDYKGAIAVLEDLWKKEQDADESLRRETGALLERLRSDSRR